MATHSAFKSARDAANKALELDYGLAEAHNSLALVHWLYDWDWTAADREFRKAIELNPRYVMAHHWRGLFLGERGRFDEAEAEMLEALKHDPSQPQSRLTTGGYSTGPAGTTRRWRNTVKLPR